MQIKTPDSRRARSPYELVSITASLLTGSFAHATSFQLVSFRLASSFSLHRLSRRAFHGRRLYLSSPVSLSLVPCLLSLRLSSLVSRLLSLVSRLLSLVSRLLSLVSRLLSLVSRLSSLVSRLSSLVPLVSRLSSLGC